MTFAPDGARVSLKTSSGERHIPLTMDRGGWKTRFETAITRHSQQSLGATCGSGCCRKTSWAGFSQAGLEPVSPRESMGVGSPLSKQTGEEQPFGHSSAKPVGEEEPGESAGEEDQEEEPRIISKKRPEKPPSKEEVERHRVTHYPYRAWCRSCVAGSGRRDAHKRRGERCV